MKVFAGAPLRSDGARSISFETAPRQAAHNSAPILFAKLVECGTAKQTTVFAKSVCAFRCDRIHARRRVVNLACSCSGEARLHRIDLIREPTSVCGTRSRNDIAAIRLLSPARSGGRVLSQIAGNPYAHMTTTSTQLAGRRCALRAGWPWRLPARAPTDPDVRALAHPVPRTDRFATRGWSPRLSDRLTLTCVRTSMCSTCFPRSSLPADASLSSTGSSRASSPASTVLSRRCDFLPPFPPRFVAFAWWYLGWHSFFSLLGGRAPTAEA